MPTPTKSNRFLLSATVTPQNQPKDTVDTTLSSNHTIAQTGYGCDVTLQLLVSAPFQHYCRLIYPQKPLLQLA